MILKCGKNKKKKGTEGTAGCVLMFLYDLLRCITAQPHSSMAECIILFNMMKKQNVANGDVIYASVLQ